MTQHLHERVIFVTGASRGIGRAIAELAAQQGAALALFATSESGTDDTAAACREFGAPKVTQHAVDAGSSESVAAVAKAAIAEHGACHGLVNNAGITRDGLLMRMADEDLDRVLDVNLKGAFYFVRALSRPLMKAKGASVVNITSVVGITGNGGQSNYAASKAGLIGFTKSIAKELGGRAVRCNAVAPGWVETDMTRDLPDAAREAMLSGVALGRVASPQEIAPAVVFLLGPQAAYITGQVLAVDGGMV